MFNLEMMLKKTGIFEFFEDNAFSIGMILLVVGIVCGLFMIPFGFFIRVEWLILAPIICIIVGIVISVIAYIRYEYF